MKRTIAVTIFCLVVVASYSQRQTVELSHYIFPEFTRGTVLMKSGLSYEASLNYNALSQEMIFDDKGKKLAIGKEDKERLDTVCIMKRKFFVVDGCFVELLYSSGFELYAEHKCDVKPPGKPAAYGGTSETSSVTTYSGIISDGMVYELKLPEGYVIRPFTIYWLKMDDEVKKFINLKQLTRLFDDRKDQIREYISSNRVDYDDQESLINLIKYLESR